MDAIDIKLLKLLQHNAELTIQELSSEVHLSTTPCWKRINQLKSNGYINKTVALVDRREGRLQCHCDGWGHCNQP